MGENKLDELIFGVLGYPGRLLSGSKIGYESRYPNHKIVFNGNLVIEGQGKVWFGDLNLTLDGDKLQRLANESGAKVYVLREMDARFKTEDKPLIGNAVATYTPEAAANA